MCSSDLEIRKQTNIIYFILTYSFIQHDLTTDINHLLGDKIGLFFMSLKNYFCASYCSH